MKSYQSLELELSKAKNDLLSCNDNIRRIVGPKIVKESNARQVHVNALRTQIIDVFLQPVFQK